MVYVIMNTSAFNHNTLGDAARPLIPNAEFKALAERIKAGEAEAYIQAKGAYTFEAFQRMFLETLYNTHKMTKTAKQQLFYDLAMSGRNVFLTGKAGTGKTWIVKEVLKDLAAKKRRVVALAPTGIAAVNIGGQTLHSLFALDPFAVLTFKLCRFLKPERRLLLMAIQVIVIDEISMLRPDVLDALNWTFLKNGAGRLSDRQIIFVGDLKQLEAPLSDNMRSVLLATYGGVQFMNAEVYPKLKVEEVELDEIMRQSDPEFIEALNIVRDGGKSPYFRDFVSTEAKGVVLAPFNSTVQKYNVEGLQRQEGEEYTFTAILDGEAKASDFSLEAEVKVKDGCKVMFLSNSQNNNLANGTLGTFRAERGCFFIQVGNVKYSLERVTVTKKEYVLNREEDRLDLVEIGSITQYPIKLAYALTIHKSQGLTFDECTVDLTRPCFQPGQLYTALSRVKTPSGLRLIV